VNDRLEVSDSDVEMLALTELGEMDPVILFLFKFETVIKLVHFDLVRVVTLQDFGEDPTV
jgi:hypothetical protein